MTDLITRLQNAETGSRELDAEVWCWLNGYRFEYVSEVSPRDVVVSGPSRSSLAHYPLRQVPNLTTSLDALVTLKEERLPGWKRDVTCADLDDAIEIEMFNTEMEREFITFHKQSEALAFLIAILKALEIENGND